MINVGVDVWDYQPVPEVQLVDVIGSEAEQPAAESGHGPART